jgi:hypothetical protein
MGMCNVEKEQPFGTLAVEVPGLGPITEKGIWKITLDLSSLIKARFGKGEKAVH